MAFPTFVAAGTMVQTVASGSVNVSVPAGVADGDYLVLEIMTPGSGSGTTTPPGGWTLICKKDQGTFNLGFYVYGRRASSEPANYSIATSSYASTGRARILAFRDVGEPPVNATAVGAFTSTATPTADSLTTTVPDTWHMMTSWEHAEGNRTISATGSQTSRASSTDAGRCYLTTSEPIAAAGVVSGRQHSASASGSFTVLAYAIAGITAGDTTPPTLTSPTGTGGALTCSGGVTTDEGNGTLYAVVTASSTAPSAAQVKAGQDHTGAAALRVSSQAVSSTGTKTISSGSVTAGTRYWHFMHEDSAANQSAVVSSASFTVTSGGDTTAPVLSSPVGTATGPTTATVGATTDEGNGTLYAVVTTSATQPSVAQIKAGQNHTGAAAAWSGSVAVSSTGAKTLNATGLTGSTTYYAHLVHSDAAGNDSNRVVSASFTTSAPTTAGLTSSPLKDNTGTLHLNAPFEAFVLNVTTGALVVRKTGLTSHATTGVVTFTDAALTAATQYRVVWRQTTTGAQGIELLTAA